jgi:hypothetical protein
MMKLWEIGGRKEGGSIAAIAGRIMFRFDVPVTTSAEHLRDTVFLCADIADELELALTNAAEYQVPEPDE